MYTYSTPSNSTYSPARSSKGSKAPTETYDYSYSYYSPRYEEWKPRYFKSHTRQGSPTIEKSPWAYTPPPYWSTYTSPQYEYMKANTDKRHTRRSSISSETIYKFSTPSKDKKNEPYYRYTYTSRVPKQQEKAKQTISPKEAFLDYYQVEDDAKMSIVTQSSDQNNALPRPRAPKPIDDKKNITSAAYVPAGYSTKNWDPSEQPILLLGSVFDANSLGKWIYDWTVFHRGPGTPASDTAGELWLLLLRLAKTGTESTNMSVQERLSSKLGRSSMISRGLHAFTCQILHSGVLKLVSWGVLIRMASSLSIPADSGDISDGSPGNPRESGFLSMTSWLSPLIGFVFAAGVTASSKPHSASRIPGAMALVCNYVSLVASADAATPPAVVWT